MATSQFTPAGYMATARKRDTDLRPTHITLDEVRITRDDDGDFQVHETYRHQRRSGVPRPSLSGADAVEPRTHSFASFSAMVIHLRGVLGPDRSRHSAKRA